MQVSGLYLPELFGPLARQVEPRALPSGARLPRLARAEPDERVAFALRPSLRTGAAMRRLVELAAGTIGPSPADPGPHPVAAPREIRLTCSWTRLQELAGGDPLASLLVAAQHALSHPPSPPRLMGILNVTPDSFSDGGLYRDAERAIEHGLALVAGGADLVDVGGESTRPGAAPVDVEEELERVVPVVRGLARAWSGTISVDTRRARVARAALDEGARMVNDVSAGRSDEDMLPLLAERSVDVCLMHMQGEPATMQLDPRYGDVVADVAEFLRERVHECLNAGIALPRIMLDPGIGFGKRVDHNLELLRRLVELRSLSLPLLLGVSRKSFLAQAADRERPRPRDGSEVERGAPADRIGGTAAAIAACVRAGVDVLRVHDVRIMAEAAAVARAIYFDSPSAPQP